MMPMMISTTELRTSLLQSQMTAVTATAPTKAAATDDR